jgi:hypothetical protein
MGSDFVTSLPVWAAVQRALADERSILLHGPKHFCKMSLLRRISAVYGADGQARWALLNLTDPSARSFDHGRLFASMAQMLRYRGHPRIVDASSFTQGLRRILAESETRVILLIRGGDSGFEDEKFDLLAKLHDLVREHNIAESGRFMVVATDDYSLWHHHRYGPLVSELNYYQKIHIFPLNQRDIVRCLESYGLRGSGAEPLDHTEIARRISEVTGGHLGLVGEVFAGFAQQDHVIDATAWSRDLADQVGCSPLFARIQRALQEAPAGLAQTALQFRSPHDPGEELRSSRVQLLLRLGILQRNPLNQLALCPGIIADMIEAAGQAAAPRLDRLGMVVGESGLTAFEAGGVELEDDDFVVVHLSDLHVGANHQFRYRDRDKRIYNPGCSSLAELLAQDLQGLQLLGRIDALVVSGDFAEHGKDGEFRTARLVLQELVEKLGIPPDRLLILPGNHDIDWGDPTQSADPEWDGPGSHLPFNDFAERFQHRFDDGAVLRTILSRSGRRLLRIAALDSNKVEGKKASGIGYVSREALSLAAQLLAGPRAEEVEELTWLSVHHHLFPATSIPLEEAQRAKVTVMANAAEILAHARHWGTEVILHGHEHQPSVTIVRSWPTDATSKHFVPMVSIGAGSAGVKQGLLGHIGRNQYFVLYRRKTDLILRSRWLGNEGIAFVAQNDMVVPLGTGASLLPAGDGNGRKP